eukprot:m.715195 g.715195  ORF g.715195 m.715195 type:complete len:497 (-) comp58786_c0_seq4:3686-5176(-)
MASFLTCLAVLACALCVSAAVLDLTTATFDAALKTNDLLLIHFYSEGSDVCTRFNVELEKAAARLQTTRTPVVLAKVNIETQRALACRYGLVRPPAFLLFHSGRFLEYYTGPMDADGIVKTMTHHTGPAAVELKTEADFLSFTDSEEWSVIAYLEDSKAKLSRVFKNATVTFMYQYRFAFTYVKNLGGKKLENDILVIQPKHYRNNIEKSERKLSEFNASERTLSIVDVTALLLAVIPGLVTTLTPTNQQGLGLNMLPLLVTYSDLDFQTNPDGFQKMRERLLQLANRNPLVRFAMAKKQDFADELNSYHLKGDIVVVLHNFDGGKFILGEKFSDAAVNKLCVDFNNGDLTAFVRSVANTPTRDGNVRVLAGNSLKSVIDTDKKDTFVLFYSPLCPQSSEIAPVWTEVANQLKKRKDVIVAKMDITANDYPPYFRVQQIPALMWVDDRRKTSPVPYSGPHDAKALVSFVKKHASARQGEPLDLPPPVRKTRRHEEL